MGVTRKIIKSKNTGMEITEAFVAFIDEKKSLNRSNATIVSSQGSF